MLASPAVLMLRIIRDVFFWWIDQVANCVDWFTTAVALRTARNTENFIIKELSTMTNQQAYRIHWLLNVYDFRWCNTYHSIFHELDEDGDVINRHALQRILNIWLDENEDHKEIFEALKGPFKERLNASFKEAKARQEKAKKAAATRMNIFMTIIKYTRYIVYGLAYVVCTAVGIFIGFVLMRFGSDIYTFILKMTWPSFFSIIIWSTAVIAAIIAIIAIIALCITLYDRYRDNHHSKPSALKEFIGFFITYVKAAKDGYCPGIIWHDADENAEVEETGPETEE